MAAEEVQRYLDQQDEWKEELNQGKMFGVLIVQTGDGEIGYLAAFSGILAGKNRHSYFVPPVYDLLQPQGFFKIEEANISAINRRIMQLEQDIEYRNLQSELSQAIQSARTTLAEAKDLLKEAKEQREQRRAQAPLSAEEEAALIRESQFQKAEYKRLERSRKEKITSLQAQIDNREQQIQELKTERKTRSAALQQQLFEQFKMLNYRKEVKTLCDIFRQTVHKTPPAGAGECAAPKLLQQAYLHGWKPIAMAEFWWGDSPKTEIRRHGYYYPACKGKCEPILQHMLQGLEVEDNHIPETICLSRSRFHQGPEVEDNHIPETIYKHRNPDGSVPEVEDNHTPETMQPGNFEPEILYEDQWLLVINKPAGMLSVPGKGDRTSVYQQMRKRYPEADEPMIVHRLDMATSGLLVIAKSKQVHRHLQAQFKNRTIRKRYIAILDGDVLHDEGVIRLPLCPNPLDRPRQMIHNELGKPAITHYQVLERTSGRTRVAFHPLTGRTHQIRMHAAHPSGLNSPILGDELYGKKADRLYLHAELLEFVHPVSGEVLRIVREGEF